MFCFWKAKKSSFLALSVDSFELSLILIGIYDLCIQFLEQPFPGENFQTNIWHQWNIFYHTVSVFHSIVFDFQKIQAVLETLRTLGY